MAKALLIHHFIMKYLSVVLSYRQLNQCCNQTSHIRQASWPLTKAKENLRDVGHQQSKCMGLEILSLMFKTCYITEESTIQVP